MKSIYKMLFLGALPIAVTIIGSSIASTIDSIVLGKVLGETALAASGVCSPLFSLSAMIGLGFSAGLETVCFKKIGLGKKQEARQLYSYMFVILLIANILIVAVMLVFHQQIVYFMSGFSDDNWLLFYADQYYIGTILGFIFSTLRYILMPASVLNNKTKLLTFTVVLSAVVNAVLDIVFTVVIDWGSFGIGIATTCSHLSTFIILIPQIFKKKNVIYLQFRNFNLTEIISITKNSLPVTIRQLSHIFNKIAITYILLFFTASTTLAAFSAMNSLRYLLIAFADGLGCSVLMLLSYSVGEKNLRFFKQVFSGSIKSIIIAILPFSVVIVLASPAMALLFADFETPLYWQTLIYIACLSISLPFYAYTSVQQNLYQSVGKLSASNVVCFLQRFVVYLISNFVLTMLFGMIGSAIGIIVSEIICALICKLYKYIAIDKKQIIQKLTKVDSVWFYTIKNEDDLSKAIINSEKFLIKNDYSTSEILKTQMFIEEACLHIINNGFKKDDDNYIQFRIVVDSSEISINLKDNCKNFKLFENKSQIVSNFDENTAGIRFIILSANKISLIDLLGINCIMIKHKKSQTNNA